MRYFAKHTLYLNFLYVKTPYTGCVSRNDMKYENECNNRKLHICINYYYSLYYLLLLLLLLLLF